MGTPSQDLLRMGFGFAVAQAHYVAAELGMADLLRNGPRRTKDLVLATRTDAEALYRVLRFLASEGVIREESPRHFAQIALSDMLRVDSAGSPRDFMLRQLPTLSPDERGKVAAALWRQAIISG
jgi:hypothetical protein